MPTYSEIRRQELKHIEESLKDDRKMKQAISKIYQSSSEDIQRDIDADIMRFVDKENVSMAEAKKIISKTDVEAFQSTAKKYVEDKDFSPKANRELRRYNVTMRTNRLELLQARVNLNTVALALEEERLTEQSITSEAIKEYERQAGILNMSVPSREQLNRLARSVALSDVSGATFSDRIWANQNELRTEINKTIERALIRGEHPRNSAASIKKLVRDEYGMKKRAADRIAITEVARAQTIAGIEAFKAAEVDKMIWIAEPSACPTCSDMDGKVFSIDTSGLTIPAHPFCRCSYAGHVDDLPETTDAEEGIPFKPAKTMAQANKYAEETLGIPNAKYNGVAVEVANEWNEALRDTFEKFPELQKELKFVGSIQERNKKLRSDYEEYLLDKLRESNPNHSDATLKEYAKRQVNAALRGFRPGPNTMAQSISTDRPVYKNISGVTINKNNASNYKKMKKMLENDEEKQWSPVGSNTPRSILDHEIGHQLDNLLNISNLDIVQDLYDSRTRDQIKADLSEYAWNNNNPERYSELIAEGWAEYMNNPEPREIARVIGEAIEAEYTATFGEE